MIFKQLQAVEYGSTEFVERLHKEALPYGGNSSPIQRTLDALWRKPLSCKTVVFEKEYVDVDYQDEFSAYYSKSFKGYKQRCTRLHFFSKLLPTKQRLEFHRYPPETYLGYMILRPTDLHRMGRTVLNSRVQNPDCEFITCVTRFNTNIMGCPFTVDGMPFIQQDTQVGACAQASLWMLGRYMSRKFNYREYLPAEINRLAKSHTGWGRQFPAEKGLNVVQMLDALQGMGLSAISYDKEFLDSYGENATVSGSFERRFLDSWKGKKPIGKQRKELIRTAKLAEIAYRYIESGLPVIFLLPSHALVGIGHKYNPRKNVKLAIQRIPAFFINDDAAGPYLEMPLFSDGRDGQRNFSDVQGIIVVTPHEANLCGEDAEDLAKEAVTEFLATKSPGRPGKTFKDEVITMRPDYATVLSQLEFRTYLMASVDLQKELIEAMRVDKLNRHVGDLLLRIDYPKFLWVTEISSSKLLKFKYKQERRCLGRVLVDSTAAKSSRGVMAIHFADFLSIDDRQGHEESLREIIPQSTPFLQKYTTK